MKTTKRPDFRINLLFAVFFLGVIIYHFAYHWEIMYHPYMKLLIFVCFGFFGINLGKAIALLYAEIKNRN
jgi:hypothetical protein